MLVFVKEPGDLDEAVLLALTVYLEASGEPFDGKLGVAYVVCNRSRKNNWSIKRAILGADEKAYDDGRPYEIFSCWNDNEREVTKRRIAGIAKQMNVWEDCVRAAKIAMTQSEPDPTNGAYFYLNEEVTRMLQGGNLPGWWDSDADAASEIKIGRHTFRCRKW